MNERPLLTAEQMAVVNLAAEVRFAPNGIVSRTLLATPRGRLVLFGFDAGQELTEHTSPHLALVQILSGSCEWRLAGEARQLRAGDLLLMPPHLPHAVKATERFSMLLTLLPAAPAAPGAG